MKYVNAIRRIKAINEAIDRTPNDDRYDDLVDRLLDKRDILRAEIKAYKRNGNKGNRRKQIMLACKLLRISYFDLMH